MSVLSFDRIYDTFSSLTDYRSGGFLKLHAVLKKICNPYIFSWDQPFIPNFALMLAFLRKGTPRQINWYASIPLVLHCVAPLNLQQSLPHDWETERKGLEHVSLKADPHCLVCHLAYRYRWRHIWHEWRYMSYDLNLVYFFINWNIIYTF